MPSEWGVSDENQWLDPKGGSCCSCSEYEICLYKSITRGMTSATAITSHDWRIKTLVHCPFCVGYCTQFGPGSTSLTQSYTDWHIWWLCNWCLPCFPGDGCCYPSCDPDGWIVHCLSMSTTTDWICHISTASFSIYYKISLAITTIHDFSNYERSLSNIKSNLDNTFMEVITMLNRLIGIAKTHNW